MSDIIQTTSDLFFFDLYKPLKNKALQEKSGFGSNFRYIECYVKIWVLWKLFRLNCVFRLCCNGGSGGFSPFVEEPKGNFCPKFEAATVSRSDKQCTVEKRC